MTGDLNWNALPFDPAKRLVKGTERAQTLVPGTRSRFAICETVTLDAAGNVGTSYRLRDADKLSDAAMKEGHRPPVVGTYETPEDAVTAALKMMETEQ